MAKKYIPSGYQIINLGELDLSSSVTLTDGDAKILVDLFNEGELFKKPILLSIYDTNDSVQYMGFAIQRSESLTIPCFNDDGTECDYIYIAIDSEKITVSLIVASL